MLIALWRGKGVSYALISSQGRLLWRFVQAFSFLTDEVLVLVLLDYACAAQARSLEMTLISSSAGLGFLGMPLEHNLLLSKYRVRTAFSQQWDLFPIEFSASSLASKDAKSSLTRWDGGGGGIASMGHDH